jgi:hypothetical protein
MTRTQRRVHVWAWAVLGLLVAIGMIAGLSVRPHVAAGEATPATGVGR